MASRSGSSSSASPSLHNHPTEQADSDVTSLAKDTQLLLLEVKAEQDRSKGMMAKLEEALVRFHQRSCTYFNPPY